MPAELGWALSKQWPLVQGCCWFLEQSRRLGLRSGGCLRIPASSFAPKAHAHPRNGLWLTSWFNHLHVGCFNSHLQTEGTQWAVVMGILGNTIYGCVLVYLWPSTQGTVGNGLSWKHSFVFQGEILHAAFWLQASSAPAPASSSLSQRNRVILRSLSLGLWVIRNRGRTYINSISWRIWGQTDPGSNSSFSTF